MILPCCFTSTLHLWGLTLWSVEFLLLWLGKQTWLYCMKSSEAFKACERDGLGQEHLWRGFLALLISTTKASLHSMTPDETVFKKQQILKI